MREVFKKINFIAIFTISVLFITACSGSTSVPGIEHRSKGHKKVKKHPKAHARYDKHKHLPPGEHKKVHGVQSARDYAPGHNKGYKKSNKTYKKAKKKHH